MLPQGPVPVEQTGYGYAPVPGVAVDRARYVIEVAALGSGGSLPGVTAGGSPWDTGAGDVTVTGGPGVVLPSAAASPAGAFAGPQPIDLGTFSPKRILGKSSGYLPVDVPLSFLFEPVANPLHPQFKPSALVHLQAQEPLPNWPNTGPKGSGLTCVNSRSWGIGDAAEAYRGEGVPIIYHEDCGPLTPGFCPAPWIAAVRAQTDQELAEGQRRVEALDAEQARAVALLERFMAEHKSFFDMFSEYETGQKQYIEYLKKWWYDEALALATKYKDHGEEPPKELPPPDWVPLRPVELGALNELRGKLERTYNQLVDGLATYNKDALAFNAATQALRDHALAFLAWAKEIHTFMCYTGAQIFAAHNLVRRLMSLEGYEPPIPPLRTLSNSEVPPPPEAPQMVWKKVDEEVVIAHLAKLNSDLTILVVLAPPLVLGHLLNPFGWIPELIAAGARGESIWEAIYALFTLKSLKPY